MCEAEGLKCFKCQLRGSGFTGEDSFLLIQKKNYFLAEFRDCEHAYFNFFFDDKNVFFGPKIILLCCKIIVPGILIPQLAVRHC